MLVLFRYTTIPYLSPRALIEAHCFVPRTARRTGQPTMTYSALSVVLVPCYKTGLKNPARSWVLGSRFSNSGLERPSPTSDLTHFSQDHPVLIFFLLTQGHPICRVWKNDKQSICGKREVGTGYKRNLSGMLLSDVFDQVDLGKFEKYFADMRGKSHNILCDKRD